jgi:hypothetical protein
VEDASCSRTEIRRRPHRQNAEAEAEGTARSAADAGHARRRPRTRQLAIHRLDRTAAELGTLPHTRGAIRRVHRKVATLAPSRSPSEIIPLSI